MGGRLSERRIELLTKRLLDNQQYDVNCVVLLGAGCSVTAGIPTSQGFVDVIRNEYRLQYDLAAEKTYSGCMAQLSDSDRHRLISKYIDKAKINWTHIYLAQLIENGYVDRVLTTNFDPLVMRACILLNVFPAVYDMMALDEYDTDLIGKRAIFHLHGQRDGFFQAHGDQDFNGLYERLAPLFRVSKQRRTWIVIGYSGDNDPVLRHLREIRRFGEELYWIGYQDEDPAEEARAMLENSTGCHFVRGYDADMFFLELADQLGLGMPKFLDRPFSHFKDSLSKIAGFDDDAGLKKGMHYVARTLERLESAIEKFENDADAADAAATPRAEAPRQGDALAVRVAKLSMANKADEIIALREGILATGDETLRNNLAWAYAARGDRRDDLARKADESERRRLWDLAIEDFWQAITLYEDYGKAYSLWGVVLAEKSHLFKGAEAKALIAEAEEKARKGAELDPSFTYNRACVSLIIGKPDECHERLRGAKDAGHLPRRATLENDPDLRLLRAETYFKGILAAARP